MVPGAAGGARTVAVTFVLGRSGLGTWRDLLEPHECGPSPHHRERVSSMSTIKALT